MSGPVLITGAARRVGRAIALHLARAGFDLVLHFNKSREEAESLAAEICALGRAAALWQADFEEENLPTLPPCAAILHNASLFERDEADTTGARHRRVNCDVPLALTQALDENAPEGACVLFFLDNTPLPPFLSAYAASRAALHAALPELARRYAPRLRVNGLALGPTLRHPRESEAHFQKMVAATPLRRAVGLEEVAAAALFFLQASSLTGAVLNLDSGLSTSGPDFQANK